MGVLSTVESIVCFIGKIQTTLNNLYNFLITIGHVIVLVVIEIFRLLNNFISSSGVVLKVLKEDFEVFEHDVLLLFAPALKWIQDSSMNVLRCTQRLYLFLLSILEGFSTCISNILIIYQYLKCSITKSFVLFLDSLCLIGNIFIFCLNSTINLCSIETLSQLSSILYSHFMYIIRLEAVFGLLVLTFLTVISIKCKVHLKMRKMVSIFVLKFIILSQNGFKLLLMMIPLLISVMKRNLNHVRCVLYKYVRKKEELSKLSREDLQRLLEEEKAEKLCVICMDRKRNIILLHCQHLILCNICVSTILEDSALCPVCRRVIFDVITVYT